MTDILVEMHKLDGSLDANGLLYNQNGEKDKYYTALLEKYEISQADFDSSVVWYTKNPKKYTKIYEDVFAQLTLLNEEVKKGKYHPVDSIEFYTVKKNIWNKETRFVYSKDSIRTRLGFEIKDSSLLFGDVYILRFLQQIAPQDSSKNPQIIFRINYANGKVDSVIQKTHNDSLLRRFTFRIPVRKKLKIKSISGELLSSSVYKGTFHARIDSISLIREYRSDLQDSLRNMVEKADQKKYNSQKKQQPDSILKVKKVSPPKKEG
ncbi:MAG: DUF4296 domain-containing protein [Paludibacter sp.]|nr:DUF4296 domain-containing protein [Paludibacter sp.]